MDDDRTPPEELKPTRTSIDTPTTPSSGPVSSIGPYRILGKLGEGGMGVVFEAEQRHPHRKVAVKVIRGGQYVDEHRLRLFKREADALALLKHPNIATIHEAGHTEDGQHFFAMELVRGETLGDFLAQRPTLASHAELKFRLALLRKIADAVHYAHQRGVIHRDLKPSNVIVTGQLASEDFSGTTSGPRLPEVKILDFGLARITEGDVTTATMATEVGAIKGTLSYMSPEQARGNPDEIDVRTDVYALGVILYEMLTGTRPYDLLNKSVVEAVRVICEEPPRSLKQPMNRGRRLDSDIETIVGKALEKEADQRYASAAALSEDIARWLSSQPILARPPSALDHLVKFARRNKVLVSGLTAVVLALAVGAIVSTWQAVRATRAEAQARNEAAIAEQASEFLVGLFRTSDPTGSRGGDVTAREILDEGTARLSHELRDQPLVRARLMATIGDVYTKLGMNEQASSLAQESLEIRRNLLGDEHPETADSLSLIGEVALGNGDFDGARSYFEQALAIRERTLDADHPDLAVGLTLEAKALALTGDTERARPLLERVLAINEGALNEANVGWKSSLGWIATVAPSMEGAQSLLERDLEIRERALGPDHPLVARALGALGTYLASSGDPETARRHLERALAIEESALGPDHHQVSVSLLRLGTVLRKLEEYPAAVAALERSVSIAQELSPDHPGADSARWLIGQLLIEMEEHSAALAAFEHALSIREERLEPNHPLVRQARYQTAMYQMNYGDRSRAEELFEEYLATVKAEYGGDSPRVQRSQGDFAYSLACRHARAGEREEALRALERAVDLTYNEPEDAEAIATDPDLESLRGDSEFEALVERVRRTEVAPTPR